MEFSKHSGIYTLTIKQLLPAGIDRAWAFFSNPLNLDTITPGNLGFKITSGITSEMMYQGQIITYKIGIFPLIKSNWVTEITSVKDKAYFVDEQRFGPYKMWHHEHLFTEKDGITEMIDKISFALPFGFLGAIAYKLLIKNKLMDIFGYRAKKVHEIFRTS